MAVVNLVRASKNYEETYSLHIAAENIEKRSIEIFEHFV